MPSETTALLYRSTPYVTKKKRERKKKATKRRFFMQRARPGRSEYFEKFMKSHSLHVVYTCIRTYVAPKHESACVVQTSSFACRLLLNCFRDVEVGGPVEAGRVAVRVGRMKSFFCVRSKQGNMNIPQPTRDAPLLGPKL